jgi:RNA polymerase sigma factor (sigma-70 family)
VTDPGITIEVTIMSGDTLLGSTTADQARSAKREAEAHLLALAQGEEAAWRACILRYQRLVRVTGYRHGLTRAEIDDVTQRVWLQLFQNASRIRDPLRLPGWIATTALRESVTHARRHAREFSVDELADHCADGPDPFEQVEARQERAAMWSAVAQLPERQRSLIRLLGLTDGSYAEISRRLEIPIGSIGPSRSRALARLRILLSVTNQTPNAMRSGSG